MKTIKSVSGVNSLTLSLSTVGLDVILTGRDGDASGCFPYEALAEAVRDLGFELMDALPEVTDYEPSLRRAVIDGLYYYFGDDTPEYLRKHARRMLAAARWLEANPIVDEDDVQAMADLLGDPQNATHLDTARRLLATGKVKVER